jgi:hypothetical protein
MEPILEMLPVKTVLGDHPNIALRQSVDAIVVPTIHSADSLSFATSLAKELGAYLLVLCSGDSSVAEMNAFFAKEACQGTALYIPLNYTHPLLDGFATSTFPEALYGRINNDTSLKRNLALIFGRLANWRNIFYLDDDINGVNHGELDQAAAMLSGHSAVGFRVIDFPDNSVVRHAQRLTGVDPGVWLSGGALAVNLMDNGGFFPNIYNEDWFFLYDSPSTRYAVADAKQQPYDPFCNSVRAASEEFGDTIAEGIVRMRASGLDCSAANEADWHGILAERQRLIDDLQSWLKVSDVAEPLRGMALKALMIARTRHENITAKACHGYIEAWRRDVALWQDRLERLPRYLSPIEIMKKLKL